MTVLLKEVSMKYVCMFVWNYDEHIKHERSCLITFPNTKKRVENTTRGGVFLSNFDVFENVVKYCLECLIYLQNRT